MMDTSKIIRGIVNSRGYTITSAITQWDYGYVFVPEFEDMPVTYRLDFSNDEHHGTALPVYCGSEGGEVPESLIETGKDIFVWFFYIGDGFGKSEYKWRIPNKCKPRVESEEPTPSQQSSIDQLIVRSNEAVESAEQSAEDASASAQSAQGYAEQAESARDTAQTYANNAQASATSASQSATASANSASASAQSASEAQSASTNAETYALNSGNKAVESAQSATASATSATQAQGYANDASASAQSASGYASSAQTSAQTASSKAQDASQSASTASTKATEASQSATNAQGYAQTAEQAKTASQTAQGLAESARDSAIQAKEDAESARDEAQNLVDGISGKVEQIDSNTERIESLEDDRYKPYAVDTASGAVASFSDGADDIPLKSLVVDINPVQDLHGQDAPYPAGGGKNLFQTTAQSKTENGVTWTVNADGTITVSGTATGYTDLVVGYAHVNSNMGMVTISGISTATNIAWASLTVRDVNDNVLYTITTGGTTAVWSCDLSQYPEAYSIRVLVKRNNNVATSGTIKIQIEKGSTATDWTPYENICPISGWEGCEVNATNTNLCGGSKLLANAQNYILNGTTNTEEEYFQFSSGASVDYDYRFSSGVQFKENTRYTFIFTIYKTTGTGSNMRVNYTDGSYSVIPFVSSAGVKETVVYTSPSGRTVSNVTKANNSGNTRLYYNESGIFEGVLTADQFKQFGKSIPISWQSEAGTVYGGKLDVLSGKLYVGYGICKVKDLSWSLYNTAFYATKSDILHGVAKVDVRCDRYKTAPSANGLGSASGWPDKIILGNVASSSVIYIKDTTYASASEFKTAQGEMDIVYPLATPIEIQLTPHEVNSLLGTNNIFADTGDTEVIYRADTRLYIEKLTQPEEDDMIADSAITSGQFFMVGNSLYRALANIASGATITVGTNAQRVSLSDALNLVNA